MVFHHVGRSQIFNHNRLIAVYIVARGFMKRILALIMDTFMKTSNLMLTFLPPGVSLFAATKLLLSLSQLLGTLLGMFRIADHVPIAISHEVTDTHIQPHHVAF